MKFSVFLFLNVLWNKGIFSSNLLQSEMVQKFWQPVQKSLTNILKTPCHRRTNLNFYLLAIPCKWHFTVPWMEKNKLFSSPSRVGLLWRRKKIESTNKRSYGNVKGLYVILFVFWIVTFWKCSLCSDVLIKIINNLFFHKFIDNSKQVDELNSHTAGICLSIFWTILLWTAFWRNK